MKAASKKMSWRFTKQLTQPPIPKFGLLIPAAVRSNAKHSLVLKRKGYTGGQTLGMTRAKQLATMDILPMRDAVVMRAWFARHVVTSYPSFERWLNAKPAERTGLHAWNGAVAWLMWGGTAAYEWILGDSVQRKIHTWGLEHGRHLKAHVAMRALKHNDTRQQVGF